MGPFTKDCLYERYTNGYMAELRAHGQDVYSHSVQIETAHDELDWYIENVEEDAKERGHDEAWETSRDEFYQERKDLLQLVEDLEKKVQEKEQPLLAELSFFLGQNLETSPVNQDDVEAWAYQDGRNEIIMVLQQKISELSERTSE